MKKSQWKLWIKIALAVLSAIATALGEVSFISWVTMKNSSFPEMSGEFSF